MAQRTQPRREPDPHESVLLRIARAGATADSLRAFRTEALSIVREIAPCDAVIIHALSPRVPLDTAVFHGLTEEALLQSHGMWDELAVELGALRERANEQLVASTDELMAAHPAAHARTMKRLWKLFRMRALCIVHLIVRGRLQGAVVLLSAQAGRFDSAVIEQLRAVAPALAVADALHAMLDRTPAAPTAVRLVCGDQRLTVQQRTIVEHVALGHSNEQIAHALGLSPNTVRNHLARVFQRLGASNRADVVRLAVLTPSTRAPR